MMKLDDTVKQSKLTSVPNKTVEAIEIISVDSEETGRR